MFVLGTVDLFICFMNLEWVIFIIYFYSPLDSLSSSQVGEVHDFIVC